MLTLTQLHHPHLTRTYTVQVRRSPGRPPPPRVPGLLSRLSLLPIERFDPPPRPIATRASLPLHPARACGAFPVSLRTHGTNGRRHRPFQRPGLPPTTPARPVLRSAARCADVPRCRPSLRVDVRGHRPSTRRQLRRDVLDRVESAVRLRDRLPHIETPTNTGYRRTKRPTRLDLQIRPGNLYAGGGAAAAAMVAATLRIPAARC